MGGRAEHLFNRLVIGAPVPKGVVPDAVLVPVSGDPNVPPFPMKPSYVRSILAQASAEVSLITTDSHTYELPESQRRDDDEGGEGSARMVRPFDDGPSGDRTSNGYAALALL